MGEVISLDEYRRKKQKRKRVLVRFKGKVRELMAYLASLKNEPA